MIVYLNIWITIFWLISASTTAKSIDIYK